MAFSANSASLVLNKSSIDEIIDTDETNTFLEQMNGPIALILDELEITEFTRIGFRQQYYFPFDSKEDSENWLQALGLMTVSPALYQAFGTPDSLGFAVVVQGSECRYRIALNGIERPAQIPIGGSMLTVRPSGTHRRQKKELLEALKKQHQRQINSAFAVLLDMDAFLLDPVEPNLPEFVQVRLQTNLQQFRNALAKEPTTKGT